MIPSSVRLARKVVCVSAHTAGDAHRILGVKTAKLSVIREAPGRVFRAPRLDSASEIRAKYGLNQPFFLYFRNALDPENIRVLFKVFARCHCIFPTTLVLTSAAADTWSGRPGEDELLKEAGLQGRVPVLGLIPQEDLIAPHHDSRHLRVSQPVRGIRTSPLEAMACGCPGHQQ
ncbi:MAG: hypothetical protein U1F87_05880 [Kiritimatiellia bacterium]